MLLYCIYSGTVSTIKRRAAYGNEIYMYIISFSPHYMCIFHKHNAILTSKQISLNRRNIGIRTEHSWITGHCVVRTISPCVLILQDRGREFSNSNELCTIIESQSLACVCVCLFCWFSCAIAGIRFLMHTCTLAINVTRTYKNTDASVLPPAVTADAVHVVGLLCWSKFQKIEIYHLRRSLLLLLLLFVLYLTQFLSLSVHEPTICCQRVQFSYLSVSH